MNFGYFLNPFIFSYLFSSPNETIPFSNKLLAYFIIICVYDALNFLMAACIGTSEALFTGAWTTYSDQK